MPDWDRRRFLITCGALASVGRGRIRSAERCSRARTATGRPRCRCPWRASLRRRLRPTRRSRSRGSPRSWSRTTTSTGSTRRSSCRRVDVATWSCTVKGMVDRAVTLTYDQLAALPIFEQYVTIACVSNEVGGDLVGNALWRGVRLRDVLARPASTRRRPRSSAARSTGSPSGSRPPGRWTRRATPMIALGMNGEPLPGRARLPGAADRARAVRLRVGDEVAGRDRADDARGVRRLLGPARLGEGGADPDPVADRRAARRGQVAAGPVAVAGVAWAPDRGISKVEIRDRRRRLAGGDACRRRSRRRPGSSGGRLGRAAGDAPIEVRATDGTGEVQTDQVSPPAPDGARGHHTIGVNVG